MNPMIRLVAIAMIALPLATATAKAEHSNLVHAAASSSADVVVSPGWPHRHPCRGWHRFCF